MKWQHTQRIPTNIQRSQGHSSGSMPELGSTLSRGVAELQMRQSSKHVWSDHKNRSYVQDTNLIQILIGSNL